MGGSIAGKWIPFLPFSLSSTSFFFPRFFHAFFVPARWPPESDHADWPFHRDYGYNVGEIRVGRARFHGFMRARETSGMSFDVFSYNRRLRGRDVWSLSLAIPAFNFHRSSCE